MRTIVLSLAAAASVLTAVPAEAKRGHRDRHEQIRTSDNGVRYWRDDDGRYRCNKPDGTVGLLIGGVAGALAGRAIDTQGDRAVGTIVGAAAGALLGREVERSAARCR